MIDIDPIQFLNALESDTYQQGKGRLHHPTSDCYCVLGVLAKEAGLGFRDGGLAAGPEPELDQGCYYWAEDWLMTNFGMSTTALFSLNDMGLTFPQIAGILTYQLDAHRPSSL